MRRAGTWAAFGFLVCYLACAGALPASAADAGATPAATREMPEPEKSKEAIPPATTTQPAKAADAAPKKAATRKKNTPKKAAGTVPAKAKEKTKTKAKAKKASAIKADAAPATKAGTASKAKPAAAKSVPAALAAPEAVAAPKFPAAKVPPVPAKDVSQLPVAETWMPLVRRLNRDGIEMVYLRSMFGRMGDAYSHEPMGTKVKELFTHKFVEKPPRRTTDAAKPSSPPVYKSTVTPENIEKCKAYLAAHAKAFARAEEDYGVPKEVVVGLLMVETRLGTYLGYNSSFWSLACMAAADHPGRVEAAVQALPLPMTPEKDEWLQRILKERSTWAYRELLALIKHSKDNCLDPLGMPGSVYGAIGICQFMPSNLPKFAVDGNKDGRADLFDPEDAIPSVANYLKEHGWAGKDWRKKDRDGHHKTLKRYNKSNIYANTILAIADGIAGPLEAPATAVASAGAKKDAAKPKAESAKSKTAAKNPASRAQGSAPKTAAKSGTKKTGTKASSGKKKSAQGTATKKTAPVTVQGKSERAPLEKAG